MKLKKLKVFLSEVLKLTSFSEIDKIINEVDLEAEPQCTPEMLAYVNKLADRLNECCGGGCCSTKKKEVKPKLTITPDKVVDIIECLKEINELNGCLLSEDKSEKINNAARDLTNCLLLESRNLRFCFEEDYENIFGPDNAVCYKSGQDLLDVMKKGFSNGFKSIDDAINKITDLKENYELMPETLTSVEEYLELAGMVRSLIEYAKSKEETKKVTRVGPDNKPDAILQAQNNLKLPDATKLGFANTLSDVFSTLSPLNQKEFENVDKAFSEARKKGQNE